MNTWLAPAPVWLIAAAVAIEWRLRWPGDIPHPVRLIGSLLDRLEKLARKSTDPRLAGAIALVCALGVSGAVAAGLTHIPWLGPVCAVGLAAAGLAIGELTRVCRHALFALESDEASGDLSESRRQIGQLVSRDTGNMDAAQLRRALAETLAENFNDAFVAPLFWLLAGGPVGLWLYKTASTVDSMWGYRTPRWKDLGMAGARLDDALAWLPARASAFLLWVSAHDRTAWPGWRVIRAQAMQMDSPNAGWPMAAAAWLHTARMGGPTPYGGTLRDKPRLGPWGDEAHADATDWSNARLEALITHVRRAGLCGTGLACLIAWMVSS